MAQQVGNGATPFVENKLNGLIRKYFLNGVHFDRSPANLISTALLGGGGTGLITYFLIHNKDYFSFPSNSLYSLLAGSKAMPYVAIGGVIGLGILKCMAMDIKSHDDFVEKYIRDDY